MRWGKRNLGREYLELSGRAVARNRTDSKLNFTLLVAGGGGREWGGVLQVNWEQGQVRERIINNGVPFKDPAE